MRIVGLTLLVITGCQSQEPAGASQCVNVRDDTRAAGDGSTDDTRQIQAAVERAAATGGCVWVPAGEYRITVSDGQVATGIELRNGVTFWMSPLATLVAQPTNSREYSVLSVGGGVHDVTIRGGVLKGEHADHEQAGGKWDDPHGFGVDIRGATRVTVEDVTATGFQGDGFYVGNPDISRPYDPATDIRLSHCIGINNFRRGASITNCIGALIDERSNFSENENGGIALYPNTGEQVNDVIVEECTISENRGPGIVVLGTELDTRSKILGNTLLKNAQAGIEMHWVKGVEVAGNWIVDSGLDGIVLSNSQFSDVMGNHVTGSGRTGIVLQDSSDIVVSGNHVLDSSRVSAGGPEPSGDQLLLTGKSHDNTLDANTCRAATWPARYGLRIDDGCVNNHVQCNTLNGAGALAALSVMGSGNTVAPPPCNGQ